MENKRGALLHHVGFPGFVGFANPDDAKRACEEMNNQDIDGRRIKCDMQQDGGGRGGGGGAGGYGAWVTRPCRGRLVWSEARTIL